MNRRMTTGVLLILSLGLIMGSLAQPTASAALLGSWVPSVQNVIRGGGANLSGESGKSFYNVIDTVAKFEGTLQAYSQFVTKADVSLEVSEGERVEMQVLLASDKLSAALESLNVELTTVYPTLTKDQQEAVNDVYLSLGSYLEQLAEEATQVFQDKRTSTITFEYQVDESTINKFGGQWIGFSLGD